ncbi:polyketide synthase [Coniella lustricola]|uniref:Polyketide synthase n=1 Tax=Coniella lustricola TaxID=2025994 RepID=A0A2T3A3Q9_9PEZI|nr:polyketide synthase [Coniella lustricola]
MGSVDTHSDARVHCPGHIQVNNDHVHSGTHDGLSSRSPAPIAIIGMACRLSGNVSSLEDFWEMMCRGRNGWSEIPEDRFSKDAYWHPNPAKKGAFNCRGGYFLSQDPALFDAPFFNITRAEAEAMDPQQRFLLECTYEALENAGIPKESLLGQKIGVFVGGAAADYRLGTLRDPEQTPMFDATGNHQSIQAGRISHHFDLKGPSFSVDTACSSSLYALHQAVMSIRNGECDQAIVAACHLNLQPGDWISMSLSRLFSDQGMTFAFDNRAKSGFARGEGAGVLILKPLQCAIKDNDKIRSVIVNSGVGQDGRTVGITSPSGAAQEQLMRSVYNRAGISPQDVGFVEAHGTGTKVGDPIEAAAIHNVFCQGRTADDPLYFGSVKSNVGHLENASGVIAVIKAAMMLEKGFILPNTNFETPNENIPLSEWNMKVPTFQQPWPSQKRYISINNFGFGGSNAHCVLQRPPIYASSRQEKPIHNSKKQRLFVLSANDEVSAKTAMKNLSLFLEQHPEVFQKQLLRNLAYTLCQRRSLLTWRIGLVASTASGLAEAISSSYSKPVRAPQQAPKIAFVYTGQGAQWYAMGSELMGTYPVFSRTMYAADHCLRTMGAGFSLVEELSRDKASSRVSEAQISQPACVAIQLSLTELLASWGISPSAVTGHSSGEIGAAYGSGLISLEAAMAIAYQRGQAVVKMRERFPELKGAMMAVGAGPELMKPIIDDLRHGTVVVACENSPSSVTLSGDEAAIDELVAVVQSKGIFHRKLRVDVAYHSPHMELVANEYCDSILAAVSSSSSELSSRRVEFFSSLLGAKMANISSLDARYWVENLTKPVRFSAALKHLYTEHTPDIIVEIGPHAALEGPIKQIIKSIDPQTSKTSYLSVLYRDQCAVKTSLTLSANLHMKGQTLNMANINLEETEATPPLLVGDLKPYPWSRQKYWSESRLSRQHRLKSFPRHDLLGNMADFSNELMPTWRNVLRTEDLPWLRDHKMQSLTTFPFAAFASMAIEAAAQRAALRGIAFQTFNLREVQVQRPLLMEDGIEYEVMTCFSSYAEGTRSYSDEWDEFRIMSWEDGKGWSEHCRGMISTQQNVTANSIGYAEDRHAKTRRKFEAANKECTENITVSTLYRDLDGKGATYGPTFQRLSFIRAGDSYCTADVDAAVIDTRATMPMEYQTPYHIHPVVLDQILQLSFPILGAGRASLEMNTLYMPSAVQTLQIRRDTTTNTIQGDKLRVVGYGCPDHQNPRATEFAMEAFLSCSNEENPNLDILIKVVGLRMTPVKSEGTILSIPRELCYKMQWESVLDSGSITTTVSQGTSESGYTGLSDSESISPPNSLAQPCWDDIKVIVSSTSNDNDTYINKLTEAIRKKSGNGVAVQLLPSDQFGALNENSNLSNSHVIILDLHGDILSNMTETSFAEVQRFLTESVGVLWITKGAYLHATNPTANMAVGLCRTVRSETGSPVATLDLDPDSSLMATADVGPILEAFTRIFIDKASNDMEYTEKDGSLFVPRIIDDESLNLFVHRETHPDCCEPYLQPFESSRRLKMAVGTAGALDSFYFLDDQDDQVVLGDDEIEIDVRATGMNFKDVVVAMGQLSQPYIGIECAGVVSRIGASVNSILLGDRVCAMSLGAYSTVARCLASSAVRIPASMSFETAASIPVVYCTAYYSLVELGRLEAGERILIHAAAGGVGQASIQLAQAIGAEIFATVGSEEKKRFIMATYNVPETHIYTSRNPSFGPAIREATAGAGVDVIINSLAGDLLRESWDCIAHFGRFIEIGKRDITSNTRLEMAKFNNNATFSSVDLTVLAKEKPKKMAGIFNQVMKLFEDNLVNPIAPISVFGVSQIETAFRLLQSGKTTGKLIVVPKPGEQVRATHPKKSNTTLLRSDATYILFGGTGGLGRSISKWMVAKGARNIVLVSRRARLDGAVAHLVQDLWHSARANIMVKACDITDMESVTNLIQTCCAELPPVAGVVHASMVLRDVLFEKMTFADYQAVISSKVMGTWNIHNSLASAPLDFFIALSSAAGIVGNRGQAAYAAANTFLDAFCRYRRNLGLPAATVDLTAVQDIGYLADTSAERQEEILRNLGGESMVESEVLALLAAAIGSSQSTSDEDVFEGHCITGLSLGTDPNRMPYYASDAKFNYLRQAVLSANGAADGQSKSQVSIGVSLSQVRSSEEAVEIITTGLSGKLSSILMIPSEELEAETPITRYGLDSLNAIELRNWITKELEVNLQVLQLLTSGSLKSLARMIFAKRG